MPDDDLPKDLDHITLAYRRALWIVVLLNVGYGLAEIVGGLVADSQALKADALDFLGGALLINVISVIILLPHRKGDANIRAVWLFSRNDVFGNILVIVAA